MSGTDYWKKYYTRVDIEPRRLLVKSLKYVKNKNNALDLGAGNLRDTICLLKKGFKHIDALDKQEEVEVFIKKLKDKKVTANVITVEKFKFDKRYDIINAQYILPFINRKKFDKTFSKIKQSLDDQGIITGQLFGVRDSWKNRKNMTFISKAEAKTFLKDLKIIYFHEEEKDGKTALGEERHWHVFHFIAKKQ